MVQHTDSGDEFLDEFLSEQLADPEFARAYVRRLHARLDAYYDNPPQLDVSAVSGGIAGELSRMVDASDADLRSLSPADLRTIARDALAAIQIGVSAATMDRDATDARRPVASPRGPVRDPSRR